MLFREDVGRELFGCGDTNICAHVHDYGLAIGGVTINQGGILARFRGVARNDMQEYKVGFLGKLQGLKGPTSYELQAENGQQYLPVTLVPTCYETYKRSIIIISYHNHPRFWWSCTTIYPHTVQLGL